MEFPHLGKHCSSTDCNRLDFLPVKCDACQSLFCSDHFTYESHSCTQIHTKNVQVPVCPLCDRPIPVPRGQVPDILVSKHIDEECSSDPATKKREKKRLTSECSLKKCKHKELIPVICDTCKRNFCLKHRHPTDHDCLGRPQNQQNAIQGSLSEDEALAKALQASMQTSMSQIDQDRLLAESLARSDREQQQQRGSNSATNNDKSCRLS